MHWRWQFAAGLLYIQGVYSSLEQDLCLSPVNVVESPTVYPVVIETHCTEPVNITLKGDITICVTQVPTYISTTIQATTTRTVTVG